MLGASMYLSELNFEYLDILKKNNVKYLFTSFHIEEENFEKNIDKTIMTLIDYAKKNNMYLIPDVSPVTLKKLKVSDIKELKNIGITMIRLDFGFDDIKYVKSLTEDFIVVLNVSVANQKYISELKSAGADMSKIVGLHNFYPRVNTALEKESFIESNREVLVAGIKIQAFVTGDKKKRFPFFDGLPTLEKHRYINPYVAAVELLKECCVEDIYIGDSQATDETLNLIDKLFSEKETVYIKAKLDKDYEYLYNKPLQKRKENPEEVVRVLTRTKENVFQKNNYKRYRGSITMDNELFGRYNGEVQICKKEMVGDPRVNVIGQINNDFLDIVDYIKYFENIIFIS